MRAGIARVLTLGFASVLSLGPLAHAGTAPVGTLSGDDKVKLNGKNLTSSQLALPGDIVEAPGAATGTLHLGRNGVARLTAAARASVERSGQEVWVGLQTGYVSVGEGDQPMSVRAHGGKITASAGAVFDVAQVKNTTYITAVKGPATISDGGLQGPQSVKEGQTVMVAFLEPGPLGYAPQAAGKNTSAQTCNDPCATNGGSKECTDFKALKKKCTPMRKACASDYKNCPDYGKTCQALAGCKGYGGVTEALGGSGAAGAASASSAAAASAASSAASAAGASAGASVAATTAASAAAAAAGIAGATAAAAGTTTTSTACTAVSGICP